MQDFILDAEILVCRFLPNELWWIEMFHVLSIVQCSTRQCMKFRNQFWVDYNGRIILELLWYWQCDEVIRTTLLMLSSHCWFQRTDEIRRWRICLLQKLKRWKWGYYTILLWWLASSKIRVQVRSGRGQNNLSSNGRRHWTVENRTAGDLWMIGKITSQKQISTLIRKVASAIYSD